MRKCRTLCSLFEGEHREVTASKRILVNTLATYGRSLLALGLTLFSSRWVLGALGQSDFGLYSVVGSIIIFIIFLNNVMSASSARYFAFSLGKGDAEEVNSWFNTSLSIHLCLATGLLVLGWPIGEWVVRHVLQVPNSRLDACVWVFRVSLLSAFASMVSVPFVAMFTARQRIAELAVWGLIQAVLAFLLAASLRFVAGDRLLVYAFGMVGIILLVQIGQAVRGMLTFSDCKIHRDLWFDRKKLLDLFGFSSWSLIGSTGAVLRDQGSSILLNVFFGPSLNAAYGIAGQVSAQTNQFAGAMLGAFAPEITASCGRGDYKRMLMLSNMASKFGTLLVLLFAIPLMIEMDFILRVWLHTPPEYAEGFCLLILVMFILDRLTTGTMLAVSAHGRIAGYQATVGSCFVMTLPIAWLLLWMNLPPISIGYAFLTTISLATMGRVFWSRRLFGDSIRKWVGQVAIPCAISGTATSAVGLIVHHGMSESLWRVFVVYSASGAALAVSLLLFCLSAQEKEIFQAKLGSIASKLFPRQRGVE